MTIDKMYRCDLCRESVPVQSLDKVLIGITWSDFPHGWKRLNANQSERHICNMCLISLRRIADEMFPQVKA